MKLNGRKILSLISPFGGIVRAGKALAHTGAVLKNTVKVMGQSLPGQARPGSFEEGDIRNIADSKERFQAMYVEHGWTPGEIVQQIKALRATKFTAVVTSVVSFFAVLALAIVVPRWIALFLIPISGIVFICGISLTFKYALFEAQVKLEDFISAKEFVSREDFFDRLIG